METVQITHIPTLECGEPKQCHYNAAMYAIENDCTFVCGWLDGVMPIPHCIVENNGIYIDPTINEERQFRPFRTYTPEQINKLFSKVGMAFIPFMGDGFGNHCYDGMKKIPKKDMDNWMNNINNLMYNI